MYSALLPCGIRWLNAIMSARWRPSDATNAASTAMNLPHTYSRGSSGVECSSSPTLASSSRITDMPAATEAKNT